MRASMLLVSCLFVQEASAGGPAIIPIERVAAGYVHPHDRVEVEAGRSLNLYCIGHGSPTVVFESGLSDWSMTWALIQPAVATRTRACSYDRAGMGYSDPSPHAPTPANAVRDLKQLLDRAHVDGPIVLVGHSLGGFYAKLFAAMYPAQIVGMVLVDPSEERLWPRVGGVLTKRFGARLVAGAAADDAAGIKAGIAHFRACAEAARNKPMDAGTYRGCTDPERVQLGADILAERRRLQASVDYQDAQAREFEFSMFAIDPEADRRYERLFAGGHPFGDKALIVLTHGLWDMTPPFGETGWQSWLVAHRRTARLSRRGKQRMVEMSRHNIQIERPEAVIDAITEVLDTLDDRSTL